MLSRDNAAELVSEPPKHLMDDLDKFWYVGFNSVRLADRIYDKGVSLLRKHVSPFLFNVQCANLIYTWNSEIPLMVTYLRAKENSEGDAGGFETMSFMMSKNEREITLSRESNSRFARFGFGWELQYALFSEDDRQIRTFNISEEMKKRDAYDSSKKLF